MDIQEGSFTPPRWTIDLSLPPKDRYRALARAYKDRVSGLVGLYNVLLRDLGLPGQSIRIINKLSKLLLRRVHDAVQTHELKGISEESGIDMYLLVAFNVLLDLLMGCTSGGVRCQGLGQPTNEASMLHFRTLDWTMDPLRQVVVQLDFVRSRSPSPRTILASSITYVGFVGVLTGVRKDLSMSLNFRAVHDASTKMAEFRFYLHHLLVLLGLRPSIAAMMRGFLLGDGERVIHARRRSSGTSRAPSLTTIYETLSQKHTTSAYLIFCDGTRTISIDKDFRKAVLRQSRSFIATTNHDVVGHTTKQEENGAMLQPTTRAARNVVGLDEFLDESVDRLDCISRRWQRRVAGVQARAKTTNPQDAEKTALRQHELISWIQKYPTTNECTHYSTIMKPADGTVVWSKGYGTPITESRTS